MGGRRSPKGVKSSDAARKKFVFQGNRLIEKGDIESLEDLVVSRMDILNRSSVGTNSIASLQEKSLLSLPNPFQTILNTLFRKIKSYFTVVISCFVFGTLLFIMLKILFFSVILGNLDDYQIQSESSEVLHR